MQGNQVTTKNENGKGRFTKAKKFITGACCAGYMAFASMPLTVFATSAGPASITQPLDNLKTIVISVIGAVGISLQRTSWSLRRHTSSRIHQP